MYAVLEEEYATCAREAIEGLWRFSAPVCVGVVAKPVLAFPFRALSVREYAHSYDVESLRRGELSTLNSFLQVWSTRCTFICSAPLFGLLHLAVACTKHRCLGASIYMQFVSGDWEFVWLCGCLSLVGTGAWCVGSAVCVCAAEFDTARDRSEAV